MSSDKSDSHLAKKKKFRDRSTCLPKKFKIVARLLQEIATTHKSVKTVVYSSNQRRQQLKQVYGLTSSVAENLPIINNILQHTDLINKEPTLNLQIAQILVHEIIRGHPLPGSSSAVMAVGKYESQIRKLYSDSEQRAKTKDPLRLPRYARVQTTLTTVDHIVKKFQQMGYKCQSLDENVSSTEFYNIVKNLRIGEFVQDVHFKDVLVFESHENLSETVMYTKGHIFLQDKASYIPAYVLNPKPGSIVLDCCAAPGMKTAHLSCLMQNSGQIYALDKDWDRYVQLEKTLKRGFITNCASSCIDFTCVDPNVEPYSSVQYILLDPSCSGSGMINRMKEEDCIKDKKRISKLSHFQISMLKHALSFPSVQRIVYSTCSLYEEENECVIQEVIKQFHNFKIVNIFPEWLTRGLDSYSFGALCIRSSEANLTKGFFVAALERCS